MIYITLLIILIILIKKNLDLDEFFLNFLVSRDQ